MLKKLTYSSNRSVNYSFDAGGRLSSFTGNLGDGSVRTYSSEITYSSLGGLTKEKFDTTTPIYNKLFYNSRGQLAEIRESTSYTGPDDTTWDRGAIINHYSEQCWGMCAPDVNGPKSMTDNNGNLHKQEVYIPGSSMRWQQYNYDNLNRLQWVRETSGDTEQFRQWFSYDRFGNRTLDNTQDQGDSHPRTYGAGINNQAFSVNPTTNRLEVPSGQTGAMAYDTAGNLTNDTYTGLGNRTYDAENRMTSAAGFGAQTQSYVYDTGGQRVKRTAFQVETWQVYGFGGELLAEYPANGAATSPSKEYGYRNGQLLVTAEQPQTPTARQNFALRSNGGSASASSELSASCSNWPARGAIDGDRKGSYWSNNGGWADSSSGNFSNDWLQVDFNSSKTIDELDLFTIQDNFNSPSEPTEVMTFSSYGLTSWSVAYWDGSAWVDIPDAAVTGNNKVWRKLTLSQPVTTTKIRVLPHASVDNGYSRITEVEAWGNVTPPAKTNVALRANGATATASSELGSGCSTWPARGVIDGDRKGTYWGNTGGWADATAGSFSSDWLQVDFNGTKTIDEVDVFTVQDNYSSPSEPTDTMTFSTFGLTAFKLQSWDGSAWQDVSGASITGNNKVWVKFTLATPINTSKLRVMPQAAIDNGYSRIAEVEAWSPNPATTSSAIHWLVTDQLGTPRMAIDESGSLSNMTRHDYLPFGEELVAGVNGRSASDGYAGDGIRQQFTTKERDNETGLDFFGTRYYGNAHGRFTSADPLPSSATPNNPESFNRYSYASNNPLKFVDPNGMDDCEIGKTCSYTTLDWATSGVHPEQGEIQEYVTVESGRSTLSTDSSSMAQSITMKMLGIPESAGEGGGAPMGGGGGEDFPSFAPPEGVPFEAEIGFAEGWMASDLLSIEKPLPANWGSTFPLDQFPNFEEGPVATVMQEGETLYGVRGPTSSDVWWSRSMPNPATWREDFAVPKEWGNSATMLERLTVPQGQRLIGYEGTAAPQGLHAGGGNQIYVPNVPYGWSTFQKFP
jgi:RHS repeat-associated protein